MEESAIPKRKSERVTARQSGSCPAQAGDASLTKCYSSEGFIISVTYVKGQSVREILTKGNKSKITEAEIQTALKANAGGSAWNAEQLADPQTAGVEEWRTSNQESRVAIYDSQTRALFITTQHFIDLTKATKPQVAAKRKRRWTRRVRRSWRDPCGRRTPNSQHETFRQECRVKVAAEPTATFGQPRRKLKMRHDFAWERFHLSAFNSPVFAAVGKRRDVS